VVEGVPAQLVGDVVQVAQGFEGLVGARGGGGEGRVGAGGQDAVEPGLLVFVARGGEGGARELFGVEA
jgi:hypothetical protein